jgi:hypothetical protein
MARSIRITKSWRTDQPQHTQTYVGFVRVDRWIEQLVASRRAQQLCEDRGSVAAIIGTLASEGVSPEAPELAFPQNAQQT